MRWSHWLILYTHSETDWSDELELTEHVAANFQVYCILRIEVCFFSDIPHKPPHLCINASPSTKSSLVDFYCFQGNPQSGGVRISWREGNARLNPKKQRIVSLLLVLISTAWTLVQLTAWAQNRICWQDMLHWAILDSLWMLVYFVTQTSLALLLGSDTTVRGDDILSDLPDQNYFVKEHFN